MTSSLNGSVLNLPRNLWSEVSHWLVFMCKIWVMPCITLNAYSPTLFGHAKHKGPSILGIQISIGEDEQALILLQLYVSFQIVKDLASMILLHFGIRSYSCLNYLVFLKNCQTLLQTVPTIASIFVLFYPDSAHSPEEYFEHWFHIVYQHFLEVLFLFLKFRVILFLPHFKYYAFIDIPVSNVGQEVLFI